MATRDNMFAELAPDYEQELKDRQKREKAELAKKEVDKAKKEAQQVKIAAGGLESQAPSAEPSANDQVQEPGYQRRGRGRGYQGGGYRRRGEYRRGWRGYRPRGYGNQEDYGYYQGAYPRTYDRTGYGRDNEFSKEGSGMGNWGNPREDYKENENAWGNEQVPKYEVKPEEPKTEVKTEVKTDQEKKPEEVVPQEEKKEEAKHKRFRKKEGKVEEKEEEILDKDGTALTFKEYQAKMAELTKGLPEKKPVEKVVVDPAKISNLIPHQKQIATAIPEKPKAAIKKKIEDSPVAKVPQAPEILGTFIGPDAHYERRGRGRGRGRDHDHFGGRGRRYGGYDDANANANAPEVTENAPAETQQEAGAETQGYYRGENRGWRRRGFRSRRGGFNQGGEEAQNTEENQPQAENAEYRGSYRRRGRWGDVAFKPHEERPAAEVIHKDFNFNEHDFPTL